MSNGETKGSRGLLWCLLAVAGVLLALFARSLNPALVLFANDGPLGANMATAFQPPGSFLGVWADLNWLGFNAGAHLVTATYALFWLLGPLYFAKFYGPITLLIMGLSAWAYFRQAGFRPMVCVLGALAMALNMNIFSNVCWGLGTRALCVAGVFGALAFIQSSRVGRAWLKLPLAGLCLGVSIMEGADNGAIFSLYVAAFTIVLWLAGNGTPALNRGLKGVASVAVVAVFAGIMATQALISLLGVAKGLQTTQQDQPSSAQAWDRATTWSLPKNESLRVIIPGLHGYRMDTERGGAYWGTVGMTPGWETHRQGPPRYSGAGEYAGVLVVMLAVFALVESFRRDGKGLTLGERRLVWFWAVAALISLLLAWGRHAPFYHAVFALPYFSTIRNPIKYMHPFHVAVLIMFAYGLEALSRRYLEVAVDRLKAGQQRTTEAAKSWWAKVVAVERKWSFGVVAVIALSVLGCAMYANAGNAVMTFLKDTGFSEADAHAVRSFSLREVGLYLLFLLLSAGAVLWIMSGAFAGRRARWAGVILGLLLVVDLARANLPWIKYYNYKDKYATNPIVETLRQRAWEHRVAMPPVQLAGQFLQQLRQSAGEQQIQEEIRAIMFLQQMYGIEWLQHLFQYYNVQSLDVTQEPQGEPPDKAAFRKALNLARLWELTNTRFFVWRSGPYVDALNQMLDPMQRRFKVHTAFDFTQPHEGRIEASVNPSGAFALVEFTGALPRAKLYTNWQVIASDQETLSRLAAADFDPEKMVVISGEGATAPAGAGSSATAQNVEYLQYQPKHIRLRAKADVPAVLLLNDRFDPEWKVTVDGKPAVLLRANFTMRGVQLPPGEHTVEFRFERPLRGMYVSLVAISLGILLSSLLVATGRKGPSSVGRKLEPESAVRSK